MRFRRANAVRPYRDNSTFAIVFMGRRGRRPLQYALKICTFPRLPFRGCDAALAVTEGFSVESQQKLPQPYGQFPQEGA